MAFWKRKKQQEEVKAPVKLECSHKYRDFPWYVEATYYGNHSYEINVIEPYVCVWCGKRMDKTLQHITNGGSKSDMREVLARINELYGDHIQARAYIENDIADMQLVDRDYLRALAIIKPEALHGMDDKAQVALKKG